MASGSHTHGWISTAYPAEVTVDMKVSRLLNVSGSRARARMPVAQASSRTAPPRSQFPSWVDWEAPEASHGDWIPTSWVTEFRHPGS